MNKFFEETREYVAIAIIIFVSILTVATIF